MMSFSQKFVLFLFVAAEGSRLSLRQMLEQEALLEQPPAAPQMIDTLGPPQMTNTMTEPQMTNAMLNTLAAPQMQMPSMPQVPQMANTAVAPQMQLPSIPQAPQMTNTIAAPQMQMPSQFSAVPQKPAQVVSRPAPPVRKPAAAQVTSRPQAAVVVPHAPPAPVFVAPVVPVAPAAPAEVALPVTPTMPQQVATFPEQVAAPVADVNVGSENPSNAFAQLKELQTEFEQISVNDQTHMRKLLFNVQLREVLKKKLQAELNRLDDDNEFLQGAISRVKEMEAAEHGGAALAPATSKALVQLRKQLSIAGGPTSEQIAHQVLEHMQQMAGGVNQIRMNDEHEVASLIANSQARSHLERTIEDQKRKLDSDSGVLLKDLSKIASLTDEGKPVPKAPAPQFVAAPAEVGLPPLPPLDDAVDPSIN